ncbi:1-acyl-sn-glycerol-3-phosphate acyltransferase [Sphingobacteriales bacterium UPWRP_1]|nr:hypothetical protein BVG80_13060 [Sphingobacteriales bacterium TSM_CSM]PSJ73515.1 1-acyl-sn-glycerol-3-phosphate acyltransferase [Sphingobacteriales bacterium UPWRP_1]
MFILRILHNIWAVILFGLLVISAILVAFLTAPLGERGRLRYLLRFCQRAINIWAKLVGVKLNIVNSHLVDPNREYVFVANHIANGDVVIMTAAIEHIFTAIGKKEVENMPFLGYLFKRVCVLVDRKDPEDRRRSVEEVKRRAKHGLSVTLFPEGTFKDEPTEPLLPFHSGAFRIAVDLQLPIVPMVLINVRALLTNNKLPMHPCTITCIYTPPIEVAGLTQDDVPALKEMVFNRIRNLVIEHEPMFAHFKKEGEATNTSAQAKAG